MCDTIIILIAIPKNHYYRMSQVLEFLDRAEEHGHNVPSVIGPQVEGSTDGAEGEAESSTSTVSFEARQLKTLFLRLRDCT